VFFHPEREGSDFLHVPARAQSHPRARVSLKTASAASEFRISSAQTATRGYY
jgi:hypothetical protein